MLKEDALLTPPIDFIGSQSRLSKDYALSVIKPKLSGAASYNGLYLICERGIDNREFVTRPLIMCSCSTIVISVSFSLPGKWISSSVECIT